MINRKLLNHRDSKLQMKTAKLGMSTNSIAIVTRRSARIEDENSLFKTTVCKTPSNHHIIQSNSKLQIKSPQLDTSINNVATRRRRRRVEKEINLFQYVLNKSFFKDIPNNRPLFF